MKVKELIKSLQEEVDPEATIYASIDLFDFDENCLKKVLGESLIEIVYNRHEKSVMFSFEKGEIMD